MSLSERDVAAMRDIIQAAIMDDGYFVLPRRFTPSFPAERAQVATYQADLCARHVVRSSSRTFSHGSATPVTLTP